MFDRLRSILDKNKGAKTVNSDFMRPREEPVRTASVVSFDRKGPLPAVMQEKPPVISLPGGTPTASKPMEDMKPLAPLPPDIDPNQVVIVRHDAKKASGERFRYVDKPLKPMGGEGHRPEVIKYNDAKGGDVIKYKAAPAVHGIENEKPVAEVFKYKPVRVEIKS